MSAPAFVTSSSSKSSNGRSDAPVRSGGTAAGEALDDGLPDGANLPFLEQVWQSYSDDPQSVSPDWRAYFEQQTVEGGAGDAPAAGSPFPRRSVFRPAAGTAANGAAPHARVGADVPEGDLDTAALQESVDMLIRNHRVRGHIAAAIDPLGRHHEMPEELDPAFYGFTEADLDRKFSTSSFGGPERRTLRQIISWLRNTYCRSIGVQYMHIDSLRVRRWLQDRMEGTGNYLRLEKDTQLRILRKLTDATVFEEFLLTNFPGKKTFSLEGGETLIPLLDLMISRAGRYGVREIVLGMAHRGRLNVLTNILGKPPREIFREFDDDDPESHMGEWDVKYHLGYSGSYEVRGDKSVHLSLCFNPSHLEFINPIAQGRCRAKMDRVGDTHDPTGEGPGTGGERGMTLLIHGDAAFAGEGVVQETLNLSELPGYAVGGTVHVVVNNQIGFTTTSEQGRSSTYATDVAKMLQIPIFHVNGEDPEAVAQVVKLALDFRRENKKDVVIDLLCYRKRGHNEQDEPAFTQPAMYSLIRARDGVRAGYLSRLLERNDVTAEDAEEIAEHSRVRLEAELTLAKEKPRLEEQASLEGVWDGYHGGAKADHVETAVPAETLQELLRKLSDLPEDFKPHRTLQRRFLAQRAEMAAGKKPLDWSAGEALAFATLVTGAGPDGAGPDGHPIGPLPMRMTGQDAERGTFSHRHAVLHDSETGEEFLSLQHLSDTQQRVEIHNSPLSEAGVLGFEYGYSVDTPEGLIVWEAQFGDFVNAAQVVIDQFITSGEDKWNRLSGLVMLLPHGYEGQGPEHSSARLERFLVAAAESNIQVCYPTTPAQCFHMFRRQALRRWRKPLIVMTPKSLLRLPAAVSDLSDLANGGFQNVIPDATADPAEVKKVLLCSGKVYYDLAAARDERDAADVAILRVEQLYPWPAAELKAATADYADGTPTVWVQEEPENMGAWRYVLATVGCNDLFGRFPLSWVARPASASPATGSDKAHKLEQARLMREAFAPAN
ncbi:2-oxoglutarate dehydrogenase E1 component [Alienimonas chondri]|uniref:oxoglutarate dehydrogenase (succinyl-transferring) n=1 Tax=Alienimonas chondri TaxID=2681879 RepID=A0ABX1VDC3_9PLAN|nr:2-oxoglutarate dehydrogenase E1 component [Alienimonas chondri]NNJ25699.1 2-oxoglutarate dehydrogenase E1 component [Alienimonas chondri]